MRGGGVYWFLPVIITLLALWFVLHRFGDGVWVVDVALIVFTALSIVGWTRVGKPNPMNYGHLSKGLEIALIVALVAHLGYLLSHRSVSPPMR